MAGASKSIRIDGVGFKIPEDVEIKVISGGRQITGSQTFGDATSEGIEGVVAPKLGGVRVSVKDSSFNSLKSKLGKQNMSIIYESATKTYEFSGYILASDGLEVDTKTDITSDFDVISNDPEMRTSN